MSEESPLKEPVRWWLAGIVLGMFALLTVLRITSWGGLDQTALFYLGLPAVVALLVVFTFRPRSAVGVSMAVLTLFLAMSGALLGEGLVCLVIAAPLLYAVVALVAMVAERIMDSGKNSRHAFLAVPLLMALGMEGIAGTTILPRAGAGTDSVLVDAAPSRVAAALAAPPAYDEPAALFLRAVPFPQPVAAEGGGLGVGDTRTVTFTPRTTLRPGDEPTPRTMVLEIAESEVDTDGGRVVFDVVEDTAFARWMDMHQAEASWTAEDGGTRLTWTIDYDRTFEPSWYFGPVQAYATDLAAGYLGDTFAAGAEAEVRR
ncbi:putative membrane protein [Nocardiopsis algeriensis]|uniref:Putative membrane protein n=2 Tax=Nocardiopsis algeriensis TaxID=1478215 RepID=A0A841IX48_9ACTN|nr:putative membrane protein [Nocardiopsis algeriensis]